MPEDTALAQVQNIASKFITIKSELEKSNEVMAIFVQSNRYLQDQTK